ncbi:serine hydrolase domain-containing protein [Paludisphaera borealis]|uniref:Esterase EstB n=1 Tax=Paludisphaera borealis TaxID=1387353 RepID=A0A1U7CL68_9BACT|nr:serine hydrolase domain-containing protein [Paludisphaera borealis]APW59656.1 Esterase EstB [Paludisphaera borealis]
MKHVLRPLWLLILASPLSFAEPPGEPAASLQPYVDRGELAGATTLVATREGVSSLQAVGWADRAAGKPMRTDSVFWIASMSKPITATAIMMLVDEGKVRLDDPVERYLSEFQGQSLAAGVVDGRTTLKKPSHPITVREILSHTSGLPFSTDVEKPTLDLLTLAERTRSYAAAPLEFEPGSRYRYSNAGINTAGRIIEVVSGQAYEAFLDARLLRPLGMSDTTFWPNSDQLARLATSYKPASGDPKLEPLKITQLKYPLDDRGRQPMPAGGLFSTASDMGRFCRMILNRGVWEGKRLVSEQSVAEMTRKQTGALPENYGLGWSIDGESFGHGGAYATNMTIDPAGGRVFVFLVQHAGFSGDSGSKILSTFLNAARSSRGEPPRR